jgi:hypothetical protein
MAVSFLFYNRQSVVLGSFERGRIGLLFRKKAGRYVGKILGNGPVENGENPVFYWKNGGK